VPRKLKESSESGKHERGPLREPCGRGRGIDFELAKHLLDGVVENPAEMLA
jgi:hypothetical protein